MIYMIYISQKIEAWEKRFERIVIKRQKRYEPVIAPARKLTQGHATSLKKPRPRMKSEPRPILFQLKKNHDPLIL